MTVRAALTSAGPARGLGEQEAVEARAVHGPNALPPPVRPSLLTRIVRELREAMALLLIGAALVSGVVLGELTEAVAILVIVLANAVIALVQEGRAERALAALEELESPTATVVRDGHRRLVDARDVVPGDLVVLQAGDRVPADLELVGGDGLEADESILTGESLPVGKRVGGRTATTAPLGDRDGCLFSGTLVTRGVGEGVVTTTGSRTALGSIAAALMDSRRVPTPLQRQLAGLIRRLGLVAVVIAGGVFLLSVVLVRTMALREAFLTAVALAVAAVPEGLAAVTTVSLALGVGRMAQRGAIVRRLSAVETLGAVDVLVIDKTGTVTENRMRPAGLLVPMGSLTDLAAVPEPLAGHLREVLVLCNDADPDLPSSDPTERALLDMVGSDDVADLRVAAPRVAAAPFTSDRRRMGTVHRFGDQVRLLVKGAPEAVLPRCDRLDDDLVLDESLRDDLSRAVTEQAGQGGRVLALAWRDLEKVPTHPEDEEHSLVLGGFAILRDPPRASAASSVAAARAAGITLVMATGDHPATARAVATEIGLVTRRVVTGTDLRADGLPRDLAATLLARVDPDQKLALVEHLQVQGHVVGMTGDGVNDAPALHRADVGVALGATGSDVAREAADLVVTDDDLATIIEAVREGRTIHDNLRKVIDYLVASNLSEVMVVVATLLLVPSLGVPLFPLQLLWINLLTDGLPALALGVDAPHTGVMTRAPRSPADRLLDAGHLRGLAARGAAMAAGAMATLLVVHHLLGYTGAAARTVLFTTLVVAQVAYAWVVRHPPGRRVRLPRNRWLLLSTVVALLAQVAVLTVPVLSSLFDTVPLAPSQWPTVAVGGLVGPLAVLVALRRRSPEDGGAHQKG